MKYGRLAELLRHRHPSDLVGFKELFSRFQEILKGNNRVLELISELEDKQGGEYIFDINYLKQSIEELSSAVFLLISHLNVIANDRYQELFLRQSAIQEELQNIIQGRMAPSDDIFIIDFGEIDSGMTELVGGKNANLGEVGNHLNMQIPPGFAISTGAYRRFMAYNGLWPEVLRIHEEYLGDDDKSAARYNRAIDRLFNAAHVPPDLVTAINKQVGLLRNKRIGEHGLTVRSSASGEDALGRSFAGQFKTALNCQYDDIIPAYMKVVASRFKYGVFVYAGPRVFDEAELPMAVGIQEMIIPDTAGVMYSVDPSGDCLDCLAIAACFGLGAGVVDGMTDTDYYQVSRLDPTQIISRRIGAKKTQIVPMELQGITSIPVHENQQGRACLSDGQIIELAEKALILERYFKRPVDVEWCFDQRGNLFILQYRPMMIAANPRDERRENERDLLNVTVIMRRQGQVAQRGIAAGKVRQVREDDEAEAFPVGAIAVTKYTTPRLASIIRRASAIITDIGSPTGHMATVAREFGVPMIVNTMSATRLLAEGIEITVDAEENIIYEGIIKELLEYETKAKDVYRDLQEYRILRQLLRLISPLFLLDPKNADFTPKNCRTYHDMVRFCHEKAVQILIDLNMSSRQFRGIKTKELKFEIPLGLHIIDLGGGLTAPLSDKGNIDSLDSVNSLPMRAILMGLVTPGVWSTQPLQLGFGDLVSSLTRYSMTDRIAQFTGQNLAVISDKYANISLRLGYHFNVIDTYVSENANDNYIYFRFVGGVTEIKRRRLRAILIKEILEKLNFKVALSGDLIVGRLKKWGKSEMLQVLNEIGRLIGFSRQLDTQMQSERSVTECFQAFFKHESNVS